MNARALSGGNFTVPGPLRTKKSPSGIASLGVEERGDGFQNGVRDALIVLPVILEVPAQGGLELQSLRLAALDQLLGIPMRAQVLVEEEVLDSLAEGAVVGDAFVQIEV